MSKWSPVFHHDHTVTAPAKRSAMVEPVEVMQSQLDLLPPATAEVARNLLLTVPDFTFTVEVDLLGAHRITIYFKGATIGLDE